MSAERIIMNESAYYGFGSRSVLAAELAKYDFQQALIITDKELVACHLIDTVLQIVYSAGVRFTVFDDVQPNPTIANVQAALACHKRVSADVLIAVGDRAVVDAAKALSIIATNPEFADVRSLEGRPAVANLALPLIVIPTTAGTITETASHYVITDELRRRNLICVDPHDLPIAAIVDSELMGGLPAHLAAATGMDALTHAIESYTTRRPLPFTDLLALNTIEIIAANLRMAVERPLRRDALEAIGTAQYIAGIGFANAGLGLVHSMAHPLGTFYDIPHGLANALLLPYVMEFNIPAVGEKYRNVAVAMGCAGVKALPREAANYQALQAVRELASDLGIPGSLAELGIKQDDLAMLASVAFEDACTPANPRSATVQQILELYQRAYVGMLALAPQAASA